ncbi:MAG: radical SAM protein, partial [Ignavibacteria bacterium]|nr:radical SAM protein [Ignavibacteria bacterium]
HGMFVFGFDEDTRSSMKATIEFARKFNLESVQFLLLTPFPGTELFQQLKFENRILLEDWSLYDAHHVVFKPKNVSVFDLQFAQVKGHAKFYSRSRLLKNILRLKIEETALNIYARKLNRLWKKLNKPYLKLMSLIKKSKSFEITMNIRQVIKLVE